MLPTAMTCTSQGPPRGIWLGTDQTYNLVFIQHHHTCLLGNSHDTDFSVSLRGRRCSHSRRPLYPRRLAFEADEALIHPRSTITRYGFHFVTYPEPCCTTLLIGPTCSCEIPTAISEAAPNFVGFVPDRLIFGARTQYSIAKFPWSSARILK